VHRTSPSACAIAPADGLVQAPGTLACQTREGQAGRDSQEDWMNNKNWRGFVVWLVLFGGLFILFQATRTASLDREISYSEFKRRLHDGQITNVVVRPDQIRGRSRGA